MTQQHFAEACDVNNIINHFRQTGIDPYADRVKNQQFGYASSQDFAEALRNTAEVHSAFEELPAKDRAIFENDPALWLDSIQQKETPQPDDPEIVQQEPSEAPESLPEAPNPGEKP